MGSGSPDISRPARVPTNPNAGTTTAPAAPATATPAAPAAPRPAVAQDTFRRLSTDVAAGKMPEKDAAVLAEQAARPGVIGEAQAIRAARVAQALPPDQRAQFQQAVDGAATDTQKAFIYKALSAGHPVSEVVDFAGQIRGLSDQALLKDYTLSGPLGKETPGLEQQFSTSCVPSVAETIRGDADPIYAKNVRAQNDDVHLNAPDVKNDPLRKAEKQLLEGTGGGKAVPFRPNGTTAAGAQPTQPKKVDDVLNSVSQFTGVHYHQAELGKDDAGRGSDGQVKLFDQMASQLEQGIPTPIQVRTPDRTRAHEALAIAVQGTGDEQKFLVHDPDSGDTAWLTRKHLMYGAPAFPDWVGSKYGLSGVAVAQEQLPPPAGATEVAAR